MAPHSRARTISHPFLFTLRFIYRIAHGAPIRRLRVSHTGIETAFEIGFRGDPFKEMPRASGQQPAGTHQLDEQGLGLSPNLVDSVFERIMEINQETGVNILVAEQKVKKILAICQRICSIKSGKVVFKGYSEELKEDNAKLKELFL